jgi:hypothetical protein
MCEHQNAHRGSTKTSSERCEVEQTTSFRVRFLACATPRLFLSSSN